MPAEKKRLHKEFADALTMVKAGVHPYLVGPSGSGKTTVARQIAEELQLPFYYTGAVESAFQLRGFTDAHGNTVHTPFRDAYEKGGVFLFDELDASNAQAIVSVHAALDNGFLDAPDGMIPKHKDFHFIAAANTWGAGATLDYMGRNAMDGATLDRYAFLPMDYDEELERKLVGDKYPGQGSWPLIVEQARAAVRDLKIRHIVSPRAALNGAALLDAGMDLQDVFQRTVVKGMSKDDVIKVTSKMNFKVKAPAPKAANENADDVTAAVATAQERIKEARTMAARAQALSEQANAMFPDAEVQLAAVQRRAQVLDNFLVRPIARAVEAVQNFRQPAAAP